MTVLAAHLKVLLTSWITQSTAQQRRFSHAHTRTLKFLCVKSAHGRSLTSLKFRLTVPGVLLQALLLVGDDVLDVLHSQVVTEGVEQDVFQLLQGDPLHVELQEKTDEEVFFLHINCSAVFFLSDKKTAGNL